MAVRERHRQHSGLLEYFESGDDEGDSCDVLMANGDQRDCF
jgi:hypothetical protein